jgi:hypothetical protein
LGRSELRQIFFWRDRGVSDTCRSDVNGHSRAGVPKIFPARTELRQKYFRRDLSWAGKIFERGEEDMLIRRRGEGYSPLAMREGEVPPLTDRARDGVNQLMSYPCSVGEGVYHGVLPNRARIGLRFPVFPGTETVIPKNETVIHAIIVIFTSETMRRYLGVFGRRKGRGDGFQPVSAHFLAPDGFLTGNSEYLPSGPSKNPYEFFSSPLPDGTGHVSGSVCPFPETNRVIIRRTLTSSSLVSCLQHSTSRKCVSVTVSYSAIFGGFYVGEGLCQLPC